MVWSVSEKDFVGKSRRQWGFSNGDTVEDLIPTPLSGCFQPEDTLNFSLASAVMWRSEEDKDEEEKWTYLC